MKINKLLNRFYYSLLFRHVITKEFNNCYIIWLVGF